MSAPLSAPQGTGLPRRRLSVVRPRLLAALDQVLASPPDFTQGFAGRLTLVCGPAGFGKTTVVVDWLRRAADRPGLPDVAWLSLEAADNDTARFAASLFAALALDAAPTMPPLPLLPTLANRLLAGLATRTRPVVLVLDDYYRIEDSAIHEFIAFVIDRLPATAHLIIISRVDPPLSLGRLRAALEMNELRARDLRFTPAEAEQFLNEFIGLQLNAAELTLLEQRTEGWIAGLQLAAYALRHETDSTAFLQAFAGNNRYIADYLMEEVLLRQPAERQSFLLQTSPLARLASGLCDAVTGRTDSRAMLHSLEAANLFVTAIDPNRQWFRYHQLFADLLHERLLESGQDVGELHRRAAGWLRDHELLPEAVDHALASGDSSLAVDLMLQAAPELFSTSQLSRLTRWAALLPGSALLERPALLLALSWAWVAMGRPVEAEHCVCLYETAIGRTTTELCRLAGTEEIAALDGALLSGLIEAAALWSRLHINKLDIATALHYCRCALRAVDQLTARPPAPARTAARADTWPLSFNEPPALRPVLLFNMGLALKFVNDTNAAAETLAVAAEAAYQQDNSHLTAIAFGHLAGVQARQGHWRQALDTCGRGLSNVRRLAGKLSPLAGILLAEEGLVRYEVGELSLAEQLWLQAIELAEPWENWEALLPAHVGLIRLRALIRGDSDGARDALESLRQLTRHHAAIVSPLIDAYEALLAAPRSGQARWHASPPAGALPYLHEHQQLRELQAMLANRQHWPAVAAAAGQLAAEIEAAGRLGSALHFHLLRAAALERLDQVVGAREALNRALAIAAPDRVTTPFHEMGLGEHLLGPGDSAPAVGQAGAEKLIDLGADGGLLEMPSERERQVLVLIAEGLSNKEIAARLYLTEGTVKNHAHSLYAKLNVTTRTLAIARARQLGIV